MLDLAGALAQFPVLETERLTLREIRPSDRYALLRLFGDPLVTRYNDVETLSTVDEAEGIIHWLSERFSTRQGIRWGITLKGEHGGLIGTCGFNYWSERSYFASIGYDLMSMYWGRGITPEAVAALLAFGFDRLRLNRVEADVVPGNRASERVLEKLGFRYEGMLRQRGYWKGGYHDLRFYALLREDYSEIHR